jgi:hypothetical protein
VCRPLLLGSSRGISEVGLWNLPPSPQINNTLARVYGTMHLFPNFAYKTLASDESLEYTSDLDAEKARTVRGGGQTKVSWKAAVVITVLNLVVLVASVLLFARTYYSHDHGLNGDYHQITPYSPVLAEFDLKPTTRKINGTLFPPRDGGSIARKQPNPESDAVWEEWELTRIYPVSREELRKMGVDPSTAAKLEDDVWGLGDDAYASIFDVYHQVHCLNSLRRIAYGDYYNLSMARAHTVKQREIHINHCIDILLQSIQCNANLDLIPLHWVETQGYPFPDMSINKKCVDFEGLTEWRKANTIDMDKYVEVMKMPEVGKPGIKELPAADQYYEYWGYDNPNHKPKAEGGHGLALDVDSNL